MDIQKEKNAFLGVYVCYQGDSRKIQFNEETEQFMWRKNNVSDSEVEYVHLMNQRWYAWLACAKSKANAVPDGFVVVSQKDLLELTIAINAVDIATHTENKTNEVREMWQDIAFRLMSLGESQEQTHDMKITWGAECEKCGHNEALIKSTAATDSGFEFMDGDKVKCCKCGHTGTMDADGEDSDIYWEQSHD